MLSEMTLHLFMVSRGIGINLNLLESNLVNTAILDVGLFYVLGDVLGGLLNDRLRTILSELFQRKERYLKSFYKLVRAGKVVSFSCVESWRIVYGESVIRMAAKAKILATSQLLKEFRPHVKAASPCLKRFIKNTPAGVRGVSSRYVFKMREPAHPEGGMELAVEDSLPMSTSPVEYWNSVYPGCSNPLQFGRSVLSQPSLGGFSPVSNARGGASRNTILGRLTKLACRQAEGMPAYRVLAMAPDAKERALKRFGRYVSNKYDFQFVNKIVKEELDTRCNAHPVAVGRVEAVESGDGGSTLDKDYRSLLLTFADASTDRRSFEEASKRYFERLKHRVRLSEMCIEWDTAPWHRSVQPEWAMSVASTLEPGKGVDVVGLHTFGTPSTSPYLVGFTWPDLGYDFQAASGSTRPTTSGWAYQSTAVKFFLADGRVDEYFSGRMLSLVLSSLSQCS